MEKKADVLAEVLEQVFSKVPTTKPAKHPWRVAAGKKVAEQNHVAREATKNPKTPTVPAEQKEPSTTGSRRNVYLIISVGGLSLSAPGVCYQREAIMAFLQRNPTLKPEPRHNLRYVDWNFNIIYTSMADNKLDKIVINTTVFYGLWRVHRDIMYPLNTVLVGYAFDLVKDIFIPPCFDDYESDFDDFDPTEPGVEPG